VILDPEEIVGAPEHGRVRRQHFDQILGEQRRAPPRSRRRARLGNGRPPAARPGRCGHWGDDRGQAIDGPHRICWVMERWMKTLVDIDENLRRAAMTVAAVATRKVTVRLVLEELMRSRRRGLLKTLAGSGIVDMTGTELPRARRP
jgi:Arc/MetJ family transcription regulator